MSDLTYHESDATEREIPREGRDSGTFGVPPIDAPMDLPAQPWRGFVGFSASADQVVGPWPGTPIVFAPQTVVARSARSYVRRIAADLPDEVRDSFVQSAGMFDLDVRGDEGLDELYDA